MPKVWLPKPDIWWSKMGRGPTTQGRAVPVSGRAISRGPAILDSEDFEHNDLTANYGGDTGAFSIQTGTVQEGNYALLGDGGGSYAVIVRDIDQDPWGQGVRATWKQYLSDEIGNGGILFGGQSVTGASSISGYYTYANRGGSIRIRRFDNGSNIELSSSESSPASRNWYDGQLEWYSDGTINYSLGGISISATDTTYESGFLGFTSYNGVYFDDIQFEAI